MPVMATLNRPGSEGKPAPIGSFDHLIQKEVRRALLEDRQRRAGRAPTLRNFEYNTGAVSVALLLQKQVQHAVRRALAADRVKRAKAADLERHWRALKASGPADDD